MKKSGKSIQMVLALLAAGTLLLNGCSAAKPAEKKSIRIGVTLYRGDDAFINNIRSSLEEKAKEYEQQTGIKVNLEIMDPKGNQNTQNSQVDRFLSLEYDAICVNMVDRSAASYVINKAMDAGTPVVFFNREPVEEDMKRWEHLYYVGEDARESAVLQGELLVDAYQENPGSLDLNEDGTVGYVMLEGERSHQDSLIRTEWSVQTMRDGDIPLEKLTGGSANWDRSQAAALMEQWIRQFGDAIEVVICNNDEMALGAIAALQAAGVVEGDVAVLVALVQRRRAYHDELVELQALAALERFLAAAAHDGLDRLPDISVLGQHIARALWCLRQHEIPPKK